MFVLLAGPTPHFFEYSYNSIIHRQENSSTIEIFDTPNQTDQWSTQQVLRLPNKQQQHSLTEGKVTESVCLMCLERFFLDLLKMSVIEKQ